MGDGLAQVARGQVDPVRGAHVVREVARQLPFEPLEVPLELRPHVRVDQPRGQAPPGQRPNRANRKVASGSRRPRTASATSSPTASPCLKPCPEPPPTSHVFAARGCRSMTKCSSGEFPY